MQFALDPHISYYQRTKTLFNTKPSPDCINKETGMFSQCFRICEMLIIEGTAPICNPHMQFALDPDFVLLYSQRNKTLKIKFSHKETQLQVVWWCVPG